MSCLLPLCAEATAFPSALILILNGWESSTKGRSFCYLVSVWLLAALHYYHFFSCPILDNRQQLMAKLDKLTSGETTRDELVDKDSEVHSTTPTSTPEKPKKRPQNKQSLPVKTPVKTSAKTHKTSAKTGAVKSKTQHNAKLSATQKRCAKC